MMWNFQGKSIQKISFDRLYKFSWRPKPPSVLSADQIKVRIFSSFVVLF